MLSFIQYFVRHDGRDFSVENDKEGTEPQSSREVAHRLGWIWGRKAAVELDSSRNRSSSTVMEAVDEVLQVFEVGGALAETKEVVVSTIEGGIDINSPPFASCGPETDANLVRLTDFYFTSSTNDSHEPLWASSALYMIMSIKT